MMRTFWLAVTATCLMLAKAAQSDAAKSMHTVFTAECDSYFNWQTLGLYHSFKQSGQPGPITRLLSCTEEQRLTYQDVDVDIPTHYAPNWAKHPTTGDLYSGINKPVAVRDWLQKVKPPEDIILIIDDDTIMRRVLDPEALGVRPGWAVAGFYGYMKGVDNALALKHVPDVLPRNDTLAGPMHRRGDQVGGFVIMFKDDLNRMADDWVTITEDVRADPDAWETSGDAYTKSPGEKPWIAEMYGYSFGASKNNIWHVTNNEIMLYPGYTPMEISNKLPNVLHYGIGYWVEYSGGKWEFDKHWRNSMIFDPPPHPSQLLSKGTKRYRDLLSIESIATINAALCHRHATHCVPNQELMDTCREVFDLAKEILVAQDELIKSAEIESGCYDQVQDCKGWAEIGECEKNPLFMKTTCAKSCKKCKYQSISQTFSNSSHGSGIAVANGDKGLSDKALSDLSAKTDLQKEAQSQAQDQIQKQISVADRRAAEMQNATVNRVSEAQQKIDVPLKNSSGQTVTESQLEAKQQGNAGESVTQGMPNPDEKMSDTAEKASENEVKQQNDGVNSEGLVVSEQMKNPDEIVQDSNVVKQAGTEAETAHLPKLLDKGSAEVADGKGAGAGTDVKDPDQMSGKQAIRNPSEKARDAQFAVSVKQAQTADCKDRRDECNGWQASGECEKNPGFMLQFCTQACGGCINGREATPEERVEMKRKKEAQEEALVKKKHIEDLKTQCYRASQFQMGEVHDCLELAKKGEKYLRPPAKVQTPDLRKAGILLETKREEVEAPKIEAGQASARRLDEQNRSKREKEEWEFSWPSLLLFSVLAMVGYLLARSCIPFLKPSNTARQKARRQD